VKHSASGTQYFILEYTGLWSLLTPKR
jgi:hypothetical protein